MENYEDLYDRMNHEIKIDPKERAYTLLWKLVEISPLHHLSDWKREAGILVEYIKAGGDVDDLVRELFKKQHGQTDDVNASLLSKIIKSLATEKK